MLLVLCTGLILFIPQYAWADQAATSATVQPTPGNLIPTADAGPNQTVTDTNNNGFESVTLDGSGSFDPDGVVLDYIWKEGATLLATGVSPIISLSVGTHTITLYVGDNQGGLDTENVIITVLPAPTPVPSPVPEPPPEEPPGAGAPIPPPADSTPPPTAVEPGTPPESGSSVVEPPVSETEEITAPVFPPEISPVEPPTEVETEIPPTVIETPGTPVPRPPSVPAAVIRQPAATGLSFRQFFPGTPDFIVRTVDTTARAANTFLANIFITSPGATPVEMVLFTIERTAPLLYDRVTSSILLVRIIRFFFFLF